MKTKFANKGILFLLIVFIFSCLFVNRINGQGIYEACVNQAGEKMKEICNSNCTGDACEYTADCTEDTYAAELCACLYGKNCGELSLAQLYALIGKATEYQFAVISENSNPEGFYLPLQTDENGYLHLNRGYCLTADACKNIGLDDVNSHVGHDYAGEIGDPVYAANGGIVILAGPYETYGHAVIIDHTNGYYTIYGHLSPDQIMVNKNQEIPAGTEIGKLGNSGTSSSPHLHFEIRYKGSVNDPGVYLYELASEFHENKTLDKYYENVSEFTSKFDDNTLRGVGEKIVYLNFTLPQQYNSLSEAEKSEATIRAMEHWAHENVHFTDKANGGEIKIISENAAVPFYTRETYERVSSVAFAMENILSVSIPEAYAKYYMDTHGDTGTDSDIFAIFKESYSLNFTPVPAESSEIPTINSTQNTESNKQIPTEEYAKQLSELQSQKGLFNYYKSNDTPSYIVNTSDFSEKEERRPQNMEISVYNTKDVVNGTDFSEKDLQIMEIKVNLDHDPEGSTETTIQIPVTQNANYRYTQFGNGRGTGTSGDSLKLNYGGKEVTYYPVTESAIIGLEIINHNNVKWGQANLSLKATPKN